MTSVMKSKTKPVLVREIIDIEDWDKYYSGESYCANCSTWNSYHVRRGTPKKGLSVKCDKCGCKVDL